MLIVLFLGFSAGLPLALSGSTLLVWMREAGVDLGTIGLFALVGTPYTIKFLWAPVVDALDVPVLSRLFGRRRGWLVFSQLLLIAAIVLLAFCDPATAPGTWCSARRCWSPPPPPRRTSSSTPSASKACPRASRPPAWRPTSRPIASACWSPPQARCSGQRLSRARASRTGAAWTRGYLAMAALVVIGIATALLATEPEKSAAAEAEHAAHAGENPLRARGRAADQRASRDFLTRDMAIVVLAFVVLFKFSDAFAGAMTAPFVIDLGFSRVDYATISRASDSPPR